MKTKEAIFLSSEFDSFFEELLSGQMSREKKALFCEQLMGDQSLREIFSAMLIALRDLSHKQGGPSNEPA
jgi:hypothetical protein